MAQEVLAGLVHLAEEVELQMVRLLLLEAEVELLQTDSLSQFHLRLEQAVEQQALVEEVE